MLALSAFAPEPITLVEWFPIMAATVIGSLLPDVDSDESTIRQATATAPSQGCIGKLFSLALKLFGGHRALTHTLLAWVFASFWVMVWQRGNLASVGFSIGYLAHLLADAITVQGVPLLWPLWPKRIKFLPGPLAVRTGSLVEYVFVVVACAVVLNVVWLR